jgi:hypothetical protein
MSIAILLHHARRILQARPAFRAANSRQGFRIAGAQAWDMTYVDAGHACGSDNSVAIIRRYLDKAWAMMKETKFFRKQADKAERMARSASDAETSQSFSNLAKAYRSQADALKAKRKSGKKRRTS